MKGKEYPPNQPSLRISAPRRPMTLNRRWFAARSTSRPIILLSLKLDSVLRVFWKPGKWDSHDRSPLSCPVVVASWLIRIKVINPIHPTYHNVRMYVLWNSMNNSINCKRSTWHNLASSYLNLGKHSASQAWSSHSLFYKYLIAS